MSPEERHPDSRSLIYIVGAACIDIIIYKQQTLKRKPYSKVH
jgi:hypothetical protein